jgi:phage FluMu gp28-like protein
VASTFQAQRRKSRNLEGLSAVPLVALYPYEQRFILDHSRLKGWVKGRQIGGSFTATLDMVLDAIDTGNDWNTMSRTGRQAKKLLRKATNHVRAIDTYVRHKLRQSSILEKPPTSEEIVLTNGAVMSALPCDPDTTVGDTVNWLLDEWPLYPDSERLFGTLKPSIMHGKRLVGIGTPRGRHNKFAKVYQTWKELSDRSGWSFHETTIEQALADGMILYDNLGAEVVFAAFKEQEIRDIGHEMWLQEYMCQFLDAVSAFLGWDAILDCGKPGLSLTKTPDQLARLGLPLYAGVDIGIRHNLTVIWILSLQPDGRYRTECVIPLSKTAFRTQEELLWSYLRTGAIYKCKIDYLGVGMQLAENARTDFAGIVEEVTFTNPTKQRMAERLRIAMEGRNFEYPADDDIAEDFGSVEKIVTDGGLTRIEATRGGETHGDYFWAAALATEAAAEGGCGEVAMAVA